MGLLAASTVATFGPGCVALSSTRTSPRPTARTRRHDCLYILLYIPVTHLRQCFGTVLASIRAVLVWKDRPMLRRFAFALLVAVSVSSSAFAAHARPGTQPHFFAPLTITTATGVAYSVGDINTAYNVSPLLDG